MMQEQGGHPRGERFKRNLLGLLRQRNEADPRVAALSSELQVRNSLAAMARIGALVTYYLRQPSYTDADVEATHQVLCNQARILTEFLGPANDRAITHQGFHFAQAIRDYGEQVCLQCA